jgi:hypothetical protein
LNPSAPPAGPQDGNNENEHDNVDETDNQPLHRHFQVKAAQGAEQLSALAHHVSADFGRAVDPMSDPGTDSDTDTESNLGDPAPIVQPDGRLKYDHSYRPPSDILLPSSWMFKERYVSSKVVSGLLDVYYSSNTFTVCNLEGAFKFLRYHRGREHRRAMDCRPIERIHNLQVRIKAEHFPYQERETESANEIFNQFQFFEREFLCGIVSSLRELWSLIQQSEPHELHMELIIMTDFPSPTASQGISYHTIFNFLQAIRAFVYKTKYERENTTIRVTHHDDALWPFPKNYTDMFGLTKEQWERVGYKL